MTTEDVLSDREREIQEHLQKAQELGVTLKEYSDAYGLDVKELYRIKAQLARKAERGGKSERAVEFLPVQVGPVSNAQQGSRRRLPILVTARAATPSNRTEARPAEIWHPPDANPSTSTEKIRARRRLPILSTL